MDGIENVRSIERKGSTERWMDETPTPAVVAPHPLDSPESEKVLKKLLEWYNQEREKQAANRYQMAIDHDYYDGLQWSEEDAQEVVERGQAPLTFNETAPTIDWIIGTEKRTRVDFKVLPRTEDDVEGADTKTKVLKWLSDINKTAFNRSLAFSDTAKVGLGWLEDGAQTDPEQEPIYSGYENWRYMLHDSSGAKRDPADWRYVFRVKWLDLDIAKAMFKGARNRAVLERAAVAANLWGNEEDEDMWYLGEHYQSRDSQGQVMNRRSYVGDSALIYNRRARVKLHECWYRDPQRVYLCMGEVFHGKEFDRKNPAMVQAAQQGAIRLQDQLRLKVRCAVFTEGHLLQDMPSPYRHNRFPFTPIWCYRRGRDGACYGVIRRIRDPQDDLNKRHSKALFILSVNRVIADADSVEDHEVAREEAARPDAYIIKKKGTTFEINNNVELAEEHLMMMDRGARMIRQSGGVTDDNLGRQTNAISGEAIKARQLQGSVVTAEVFDNLRYAVQHQGEIQVSLAEQFLTEPKVIRLTQARGKIDWVKINQPEYDAEGNLRFVNDITASQSDFVVDQQDFTQSVRQAMFEAMSELVGKVAQINPEYALRILRMALEFSDLPNKAEMAGDIKQMLGIVDKGDLEKMDPEEQQAHMQAAQEKQEAAQLQKAAAQLEVAEKQAKVNKLNADAEKVQADAANLRAEAQMILSGEASKERAAFEEKLRQVEERAAAAVDTAREQMEQLKADARNRQLEIDSKAATDKANATTKAEADKEIARIAANGKVREAEIIAPFKAEIAELTSQLKDMGRQLQLAEREHKAEVQRVEKEGKADRDRITKEAKDAKAETAAKEKDKKDAAPAMPQIVFQPGAIQVNTAPGVGKTVTATTGSGKVISMRIVPDKPKKD